MPDLYSFVIKLYIRLFGCAPMAQGIERLPPEQKAAGSNPAGGTKVGCVPVIRTCEGWMRRLGAFKPEQSEGPRVAAGETRESCWGHHAEQ